jgi:hypothetical protein
LSFVIPRIDWMNHLGRASRPEPSSASSFLGPVPLPGTEVLWQILAWVAIAGALASFWMMANHGMADVQWVLAHD